MPTKAERAQRAKEKKEKKALEQAMKQSREKVEEARALMETMKAASLPKAVAALDAAIQLWGENEDAFRCRGDCNQELRNLDAAVDDYSSAISIDEASLSALEGRASCFMSQEKWDAAIADWSRIIDIAPQLDHPFNMRATSRLQKRPFGLRLRNDDLEQVLRDFNQALRLNPNNFHATCNLARCYDEHGLLEEAIEQYTSALRLKEEYTYAAYRRGVVALTLVEAQADDKARADRIRQELVLAKQLREEREAAARSGSPKVGAAAMLERLGVVHPLDALSNQPTEPVPGAKGASLKSKAARTAEPAATNNSAPKDPFEEEARSIVQAERAAEEASTKRDRLLRQALEDFTRVLPSGETPDAPPESGVPCLLQRAACYLYLEDVDKAQEDLKTANDFLAPLKGEEMQEASFGGTPASTLKRIYEIRNHELQAQLSRKRKPMRASTSFEA